ncbi:MAG: hypothetical protein AMXMBFR7_01800 [Planctomycetota bacterium]
MSADRLWLPFPAGVPHLSGGAGEYVNTPGKLPILHLFPDFDLFWVRRGEATWTLRDGRRLIAPAGSFALLPPHTPAWIDETKPGLVLRYTHFAFRSPAPRVPAFLQPSGPSAFVPLTFAAREAPSVRAVYAKQPANKRTAVSDPYAWERWLLDLIAELARFAHKASARETRSRSLLRPLRPQDARVERLRALVDADPARAWRVADLAAQLELSPGHLHALCVRTLGRSLKRYLVEARLRLGLRLLKEHPAGVAPTVREVAEACGFSSQHFFSRQFKAHYRVSPLRYRNQAGVEEA